MINLLVCIFAGIFVSNIGTSIPNCKQCVDAFSAQSYASENDRTSYEHCDSTDYPNATYISNAFYFDKLGHNYGDNDSNVCGIIATQILLGYYDSFASDNIVDEEYDLESTYSGSSLSVSSWATSPGTGHTSTSNTDPIPDDQRFKNVLIDKSIQVNIFSPVTYGMGTIQVWNLLNSYLQDKDVGYDIDYYIGSENYYSKAESSILNGNPFIGELDEHYVVVYGYDSDYFYFDSGYGYTARETRDKFTEDAARRCFIGVSITTHAHSNNYYNTSNHYLVCGCGSTGLKRLRMDPGDWGFEERYYFDYKDINHNKCNLSFATHRLRTGYIQSAVANLSPRRYGAGFATLDINIPYNIRGFNVDMAWWSAHELQSGGYARIMYLDSEVQNNWITDFVDIHSLGLNTSYLNLTKKSFLMPEATQGLRFCASNSATGDRNLGRLSLGRMDIDYYV